MNRWDKFNNFIYRMLKFIYLNVLWIMFTILGLGIFGIFPATGAMFAVTRRWARGENRFNLFRYFWTVYKEEFVRINGLGLIFLLIAYFLYFDYNFLVLNSGKFVFLIPVLIFVLLSALLSFLFFFPVYTHFKLSFFQYIKQSFLIAVVSPIELILTVLLAVVIYVIAFYLPGTIPLFVGSVFAYFSTLLSIRAFNKIDLRKNL